ncbi:hypothetical protein ACFQLX_22915 [Streptomyces polyrhachis]|uniref:GH16 domain-containing protein n=1 Tax=Streptomyces polyrhachis TaxID=1282885 RepID=A0ABW2GLG1_9ACTN
MKKSPVAALAAATLLVALCPGHAEAVERIARVSLTPTAARPGASVSTTLKTRSPTCVTVKKLGVSVRDALWNEVGSPRVSKDVRICPEGHSFTPSSRTFPAGTYTQFGWYVDNTGYHELEHSKFTVTGGGGRAAVPGGGKPVWAEEFNEPLTPGKRWTTTGISAYRYWNRNPDGGKLDWVDPDSVEVSGGVADFVARPAPQVLENGRRAWTTGLITTERSAEGFQVRTGDYVEARVQLPTSVGAWASVWTWKEGGGEIDILEYHADTPDLLEQCNHVRYSANFHRAPVPEPGEWTRIGVKLGKSSVDWYIDGALVYQDSRGVPEDWSAYPVMTLSLNAGTWHPAPRDLAPIHFKADYLRVYR